MCYFKIKTYDFWCRRDESPKQPKVELHKRLRTPEVGKTDESFYKRPFRSVESSSWLQLVPIDPITESLMVALTHLPKTLGYRLEDEQLYRQRSKTHRCARNPREERALI